MEELKKSKIGEKSVSKHTKITRKISLRGGQEVLSQGPKDRDEDVEIEKYCKTMQDNEIALLVNQNFGYCY